MIAVRDVSGKALFFLNHKNPASNAVTNNKNCKRKGIKNTNAPDLFFQNRIYPSGKIQSN